MIRRLLYLLVGTIAVSFGIAAILNSNLGAFSITLSNLAISQWLHIDIAIASFLTELLTLLYAMYHREGFGLTCLCSMTVGSFFTSLFIKILPSNPWMSLFFFVMIAGFALQGKAGFGGSSTNILMEALVKHKGMNLVFTRTIIDGFFLIIAFIAFPSRITIWTLLFTFGTSIAIKYIYKLFKYDPSIVQHSYIILFNKRKEKIHNV